MELDIKVSNTVSSLCYTRIPIRVVLFTVFLTLKYYINVYFFV